MVSPVDFTSENSFAIPLGASQKSGCAGQSSRRGFPIVGQVWITTTYDTTAGTEGIFDLHAAQGGRRWPGCAGGCQNPSRRLPTTC